MHTVDIAEATGFALLGVVKTTGPVDSNVALLSVQSGSSLHAATSTDAAEFEEAVKYRAVITDVVFALLAHVAVHIVRGDFLEEVNIVVGVELCHFATSRWLGALLSRVSVNFSQTRACMPR